MAVSFPRADIQLHYNRNQTAWQHDFEAIKQTDRYYRLIGDASFEIPASATSSGAQVLHNNKNAHDILSSVSKVIQAVPHVAPSLELIENLIIESEDVDNAFNVKDLAAGTSMVYCSADSMGTGGRDFRRTPIVAYVSGPTGCDVGVAAVIKEYGDMPESSYSKLIVHKMIKMDKYARHLDIPIKQLCSAEHIDGSFKPYVAIRTDSQVQYFKVLDVRTSSSVDQRFQLRPMGVIRQDRVEVTYCDICINPWYELELGLIDDQGQWSIWDLVSKKREGSKPRIVFQDKISRSVSNDHHSKWKIIWGKDVRSLIISDGRAIYWVNFRIYPIQTVKIQMKETYPIDNCILSLQRFNSVPDYVFVLTNYSVLCLTLKPEIEHVLTRKHFRHALDFSLRMTAVRTEQGAKILLFSNINRDLSVLSFTFSDASPMQHGGEMNSVRLPNTVNKIKSLLSWNVIYKPDNQQQVEPPRSIDATSNDICCLVTFLQCGEFEVIRQHIGDADLSLPLTKERRLRIRLRPLQTLFVNDTDSDDSDDMTREFVDVHPQWAQRLTSTGDISNCLNNLYISKGMEQYYQPRESNDFYCLYKSVFDGSIDHNTSSVKALNASELYLSSVLNILKTKDVSSPASAVTLLDVVSSPTLIDDIDAFMQEVMKISNHDGFSQIHSNTSKSSSHGTLAPHWQLLYKRLLANYLTPLPSNTYLRFKLQRERAARMMAIDYFLACQVLCFGNTQLTTAQENVTLVNNSQQSVALVGLYQPNDDPRGSTLASSKRHIESFPAPEVIEDESPDSGNVRREEGSGLQARDVPGFNGQETQALYNSTPHLEAFGCAANKTPFDHDLSCLSEDWTIGEDPAIYNWAPINRRQKDSSRTLTHSKKSKSRRKREKPSSDLKSSQAFTDWSMPSSQPFSNSQEIFSTTRPSNNDPQRLAYNDRPMSSQAKEDEYGIISSQVVSGRYGGRSSKTNGKKQKKKWTAGF